MVKKEEKKPNAAAAPSGDGKKSYLEMLKKPKHETPPPAPEPTSTNGAAVPAAKKQPTKPPTLEELPTLGGVVPVITEKPVWGPKKTAPIAVLSAAEKASSEKEKEKEEKPELEASAEAVPPEAAVNFKLVEAKTKKAKKGKHQAYEKDANGGEAAAHEADAAEELQQADEPLVEDAAPVLASDANEQEVPAALSSTQAENEQSNHKERRETEPKAEVRPISPPVAQPTDAVVPHGVPPAESPFRRRSDPLDEEVPHRVEPVRAPVSPPTASVGRSKAQSNGSRMDWAASGWPLADGVDADSHYDVPTLPMPESRHSTPSHSAQRVRSDGVRGGGGFAAGATTGGGWRWVEGGADLELPPSVTAADQYYVRFAAPDSKFYDKEPALNPKLAELAHRIESEARALEEAKKQLLDDRARLESEANKLSSERLKIEGEKTALIQNQRKLKAEQDASRTLAETIKRDKERLDLDRAELEDQRRMMAQGLQLALGPHMPAQSAPHHAPASAPSHHRPGPRSGHGGYGFDEPPQSSNNYGGGASSGMSSEWYPNGQYQDYGSYHANGSYGGSSTAVSRNAPFSSHPQAPQVQVGQPSMARTGPIGPAPGYSGKAPGMRTARPMGEAHAYPRPGPPGVGSRHPGDHFQADSSQFANQW